MSWGLSCPSLTSKPARDFSEAFYPSTNIIQVLIFSFCPTLNSLFKILPLFYISFLHVAQLTGYTFTRTSVISFHDTYFRKYWNEHSLSTEYIFTYHAHPLPITHNTTKQPSHILALKKWKPTELATLTLLWQRGVNSNYCLEWTSSVLSRIRLKQEFYQAFNDSSEHINMECNKKIIQTNH